MEPSFLDSPQVFSPGTSTPPSSASLFLPQECPCVLSEEVLQGFRKHSDETPDTPLVILTAQGRRVSPGEEVAPNSTISAACSNW